MIDITISSDRNIMKNVIRIEKCQRPKGKLEEMRKEKAKVVPVMEEILEL